MVLVYTDSIENEQWLGGLTASLFGNTLHLSM